MDDTKQDIYTTHLSRRFKKKAVLNAVVGLALALFFLNEYLSRPDASGMALVGAALAMFGFLVPAFILFTIKYPLRITQRGIVTRYFFPPGVMTPWDAIVGTAIHSKRNNSCLLYRDGRTGEPLEMAISWSMIAESEREVVTMIQEQLALRGHRVDWQEVPETQAEERPNAMKDFWK